MALGSGSVIVAGARTPIGKLSGALSSFSAVDLGGIVIREALLRAGLTGDQVDYVILGQVLQAGAGQVPARQAAVAGGVPMSVPALSINKVCLSGLDAIALADQLIRAGEFDVVVAGGMESMTNAPHLLPGARKGLHAFGSAELVDSVALGRADRPVRATSRWAPRPSASPVPQAGLTRADQDAFAALVPPAGRAGDQGPCLRRRDRAPSASRSAVASQLLVTADEGIRPDTTS